MNQRELFQEKQGGLPEGFRYKPELISQEEEAQLIDRIERLEFAPFEFHGFMGKRRVVSFGWRYDFNHGGLKRTEDIPEFLGALREAAARFLGYPDSALQQVLVTEYSSGSGNWLAQGPFSVWRCCWAFARGLLHFSLSPENRRWMAAKFTDRRATIGVFASRPIPQRMGTQYPSGGKSSLLGHVPHATVRNKGSRAVFFGGSRQSN